MPKVYSSLSLFLPTGCTFTFRDVEILADNESVLAVRYVAVSDGLDKVLTVQKSAVVGWSVAGG